MSSIAPPAGVLPPPSPWQRWRREPLVHFLLLGLLLFVVDRVRRPPSGEGERQTRIELTEDDLRQIDVAWRAQWQRPPTPEEMHNLVEARVREEILYREALALGLDRGDTIVKRRMAQKMEFLGEDVSTLREPGKGEIEAWFAKNAERFALPGLVSFRHLYFSVDRRGEGAREAAVRAKERLARLPPDSPAVAALADPFMFQDYYADRTPDQVGSVFGTKFAGSLFELKAEGAWQGPVESGLGWHLVLVESMTPGRVPAFEEVEPAARSEWMAAERAESKRKAFEAMRGRYQVVLPETAMKRATAGLAVPAGQ